MKPYNEHAVGIIGKELIFRAISEIRKQRFNFDSFEKVGYDGMSEDVFTSADKGAEKIIIKSLTECFPDFGIISEESASLDAKVFEDGYQYYFTIDPLDGTKAFKRFQSHGVGTMIALLKIKADDLKDFEIIASWVGDVNTQEIFYFRPLADRVHRIIGNSAVTLTPQIDGNLESKYLLLLDDPRIFDEKLSKLASPSKIGGAFKNISITDGSIGTCMARLWKGEVGAILLSNNTNMTTPWDSYPTVSISRKLGYEYYDFPTLEKIEFPFNKEPWQLKSKTILVINEKGLNEVKEWLKNNS